MSSRFSRRDFLKSGAAVASLAAVNVSVPAYSQDKAPSDKLNIIPYSKAKFACYSRLFLTSYCCIPVPYSEKDIFFGC